MTAMQHVRHLAGAIGPRGSTTDQEAEAARYAATVLRDAGLEPVTEPFSSAQSAWYPFALWAGLTLVAGGLFWISPLGRWGAVAAALLAVGALLSVLVELTFHSNPLRWLLPTAQSQNVWAQVPPQGQVHQRAVVLAHLDTHRTPLVFSTDRWLRLFNMLIPLGLASAVLLIILFVGGAVVPGWGWRVASLPFALVVGGILVLTAQADRTPYTAGANDNASGAGIALSLAQRLAREPLAHTAVWVVLTGCEEVGCYGADAFAQAHHDALRAAAWITLDSVGGASDRLTYLAQETFLLTARSDARLLELAAQVGEDHPELKAQAIDFRGAYTEGAIGVKHGLRVFTLVGLPSGEALPEWHRPTDTLERVDPQVVGRYEAFLWALLQQLDRGARQGA